ncbi:MAG: hypothetical protein R3D33_05985 [Hyphomicrobiaceae bacterium]
MLFDRKDYKYCKRVDRTVSTLQTEGECREHHNCAEGRCPLETDFDRHAFDNMVRSISGLGVAALGARRPRD